MKSVSEVLALSSNFLETKQVGRARRVAEDLLSHILKCKRLDLYLQYDRPLIESELICMREFIKRAASHEPVDYVMGEVDFFGCRIGVDRRVLIPRPETELLVDLVIKKIRSEPNLNEKKILDLCTGSGCIGISLKKNIPEINVVLSDCSAEALYWAKENSLKNQVEVEIYKGDLLEPFQGQKLDFVVCNPPYVSRAEYLALDSSVRIFEPKIALEGGERGTEFYERLAKELPLILNPKALVFFEIGSGQGKQLQDIFSAPIWISKQVHLDWSGRERFFFLEMQ